VTLWCDGWRDRIFSKLGNPRDPQNLWDIIVIGGGITGAGILREAARLGLRVLLVEQRDFAWGTSSRSSKLVHGGLRYLREGRFLLTKASVQERERLLDEGPGLIDPLGILLTIYKGDEPGRWMFKAGLTIYDLLALHWGHRYYSAQDFQLLAPHIALEDLEGGFRYGDAQTDDARLVFRVIQEAVADGGMAINYVQARELIKEGDWVTGVRLVDCETGCQMEAYARVVINATGVWADRLRAQVAAAPRIRPLRGSHLFFPAWRLPVAQSVSFLHPIDRRPVFIFPWEGATIVGTTDQDFIGSLEEEPAISPEEVAYLMAAVESQFPSLEITLEDVGSTITGIRPVIGSGKEDPSQESRDHVVWDEYGLLTVTGGKLTTFRLIALDVLRAVRQRIPELPPVQGDIPVLDRVEMDLSIGGTLSKDIVRRLYGRYGTAARQMISSADPSELIPVSGTNTLWAELRWAARCEGVCHLDDLLLRRVRLGLLLPEGGEAFLPTIRTICQSELGWKDVRWDSEVKAYLELWRSRYYLPDLDTIPPWKTALAESQARRKAIQASIKHRVIRNPVVASGLLLLAGILSFVYWLRRRDHPFEVLR
jgi:glycerol-3-phosphate dehydrogenase